jgi:hypothetical protein
MTWRSPLLEFSFISRRIPKQWEHHHSHSWAFIPFYWDRVRRVCHVCWKSFMWSFECCWATNEVVKYNFIIVRKNSNQSNLRRQRQKSNKSLPGWISVFLILISSTTNYNWTTKANWVLLCVCYTTAGRWRSVYQTTKYSRRLARSNPNNPKSNNNSIHKIHIQSEKPIAHRFVCTVGLTSYEGLDSNFMCASRFAISFLRILKGSVNRLQCQFWFLCSTHSNSFDGY